MTKKHTHKRRVIGLIIGVLLLVGLIGAYGIYYSKQKQSPVVDTAMREEVKKLNLKGDQTLAEQYASAIKQNNATGAQKVFDDAVVSKTTKQEKMVILSQNVSLALAYKQKDAALSTALKAIDINPSFETYNDAFRVYTVIGDHAKQQEMLQKAIDSLQASDVANKEQTLTVLNQQMEEVKQQISTGNGH
jgi:tetratricopeptide (TPR) repeat protein